MTKLPHPELFLPLLLVLWMMMMMNCTIHASQAISNDTQILLVEIKLKELVFREEEEDPLPDWNIESSPCNWTGITCNPLTSQVISVKLDTLNLAGKFPSSFCKLPTLETLSLADNFLNGTLSSQHLSLCSHLHFLNLSSNLFVGNLPEFFPEFPNLTLLDLSLNNFTNSIPPNFGRFPKLQKLKLFGNLLEGTIPSFLGNLTQLTSLELAYNTFVPGPLPSEIGNLVNLQNLWLPCTNLIGPIPDSFGNLVALRNLDLSTNSLSGNIPQSIARLKNLTSIIIYDNKLSGEVPPGLGALKRLRHLDASQNNLTGKLPQSVAALQLITLNLNDNQLEGEIPASLTINQNLKELKLFNNNFSGSLPAYLGRNSNLDHFDVANNNLVGEFPAFLCHGKKLTRMIAFNNHFSGKLSSSYGNCNSLYYVRIFDNEISGEVPATLWSHPRISLFDISNNRFEGQIPSSISGAHNLSKLLLHGNHFFGQLSEEICRLSLLTVLDASRNQLSGELPECMDKLQSLKLQQNMFSGKIPSRVGSWRALTELNLAGNRFSGRIPREFGSLPVLNYLDLSANLLSGEIPTELTNLKLNRLNLSFNNLQGRIPVGFSNKAYVSSLIGNPKLCSSVLKTFPQCPRNKTSLWFLAALIVTFSLLLLLLLALLWFLKNKKEGVGRKRKCLWKLTTFHSLGFNEDKIYSELTEENLIGSGGSGNVYRANLKSGQTVAVKKLWLHNGKPETEGGVFNSEIEILGRIRHSSIVKLLFSCVGEGFRILVYEYMKNGSLGEVLHGDKGGSVLDWPRRCAIAVGASQGLAYLHHDCVPPIVHRDVKSNNILLDEEFRPRIADFGLAKLFKRDVADNENGMSCIAGSYGYIAPEYAYTLKVTEKSDVYSFGVVLMELVTGKKPIDPSFGDGKDIVKWVTEAASQEIESGAKGSCLKHLMDPRLTPTAGDIEEMEKVLFVAFKCTSTLPLNRPSMRKVVELLKDSRDVTLPPTAHVKLSATSF